MICLYTIWNSKHINFKLKYNVYHSLVLSILTYGCETWTIIQLCIKKSQAFENKSNRKLIGIKYQERKINEFVKYKIISIIDNYKPHKTSKQRKLKGYGHISIHGGLCKTIMKGMVEGIRK